jgi:GNAT superfamily N-acetyltransferase
MSDTNETWTEDTSNGQRHEPLPVCFWDYETIERRDGRKDFVFSSRARAALADFDDPEKVTVRALYRKRGTGQKTVREIAELFAARGYPHVLKELQGIREKADTETKKAIQTQGERIQGFRESAIRGWRQVIKLGNAKDVEEAKAELVKLGVVE